MIILRKEQYFLEWNGHLQPVNGVQKKNIKEHILKDISGNLKPYKVYSNYRKQIDLSEILNN